MKKIILAMCALIPVITHGADDPEFIFRFNDAPGTYKIKVESVKDKTGSKYTPIQTTEYIAEYIRQGKGHPDLFTLARNAENVRISIRKKENEQFKRGGFVFIPVDKLRELAKQPHSKQTVGISMTNQFENLATNSSNFQYTIGYDSLFIPSRQEQYEDFDDVYLFPAQEDRFEALEPAQEGTHYAILGLRSNATSEQIKKAYRKLSKQWHPDKNPDNKAVAEERFKKIGEAYQVLFDKAKRAQYDLEFMAGVFCI